MVAAELEKQHHSRVEAGQRRLGLIIGRDVGHDTNRLVLYMHTSRKCMHIWKFVLFLTCTQVKEDRLVRKRPGLPPSLGPHQDLV